MGSLLWELPITQMVRTPALGGYQRAVAFSVPWCRHGEKLKRGGGSLKKKTGMSASGPPRSP